MLVFASLAACGDDGAGGAGGGGAGGAGAGGAGAGGGVPEGHFVCGDDATYCEEGVEFCVEQYADGPSVGTCYAIPPACDAFDDQDWCECALTESGFGCPIVACIAKETVSCDG